MVHKVRVSIITPERDGKLREIKGAHSRQGTTARSTDKDGRTNRKLLVFTTFRDTAEYLYENLANLANELGLNMALVSGDATRTTSGANNFNAILTNFAPRARVGSANSTANGEIDLLIATDCISEGQNLQDCDTVLNYDIHWNPVRIIQRFGRIDRIGSRSEGGADDQLLAHQGHGGLSAPAKPRTSAHGPGGRHGQRRRRSVERRPV